MLRHTLMDAQAVSPKPMDRYARAVDKERSAWTALFRVAGSAALAVPDLEQHSNFGMTYRPRGCARLHNLTNGAAFRLGHNIMQVGYFRPHNRHATYMMYISSAPAHIRVADYRSCWS